MAWWDFEGFRCDALTKKGKPCRNFVESYHKEHIGGGKELKWRDFCPVHYNSKPTKSPKEESNEQLRKLR